MTPELELFLHCRRMTTEEVPAAVHREGKFLIFDRAGEIAHMPSYQASARRGGFSMGRIEWSPQWGAWMFRPHPEAVFPMSCLVEVYVMLKELGGRQV